MRIWPHYIPWANYDSLYHTNIAALKVQIYKRKRNRKITFRPRHPHNWAVEPLEFPNNCFKIWTLHIDIVVTVFAFSFHGLTKESKHSREIFNLAVPQIS